MFSEAHCNGTHLFYSSLSVESPSMGQALGRTLKMQAKFIELRVVIDLLQPTP